MTSSRASARRGSRSSPSPRMIRRIGRSFLNNRAAARIKRSKPLFDVSRPTPSTKSPVAYSAGGRRASSWIRATSTGFGITLTRAEDTPRSSVSLRRRPSLAATMWSGLRYAADRNRWNTGRPHGCFSLMSANASLPTRAIQTAPRRRVSAPAISTSTPECVKSRLGLTRFSRACARTAYQPSRGIALRANPRFSSWRSVLGPQRGLSSRRGWRVQARKSPWGSSSPRKKLHPEACRWSTSVMAVRSTPPGRSERHRKSARARRARSRVVIDSCYITWPPR